MRAGSSPASEHGEGDLIATLYYVITEENSTFEPLLLEFARNLHGLKIRVDEECNGRSLERMSKKLMMREVLEDFNIRAA